MKRNTLRFAQLEASSIAPTVWPILGGYTHLLKDFIQWIRCRSPSFLLGIGQLCGGEGVIDDGLYPCRALIGQGVLGHKVADQAPLLIKGTQ